MKKLDWKSFAIGVLLTTTVVLSTGAASSKTRDWGDYMSWTTTSTGVGIGIGRHVDVGAGFEPFQAVVVGGKPVIIWRKRNLY